MNLRIEIIQKYNKKLNNMKNKMRNITRKINKVNVMIKKMKA